MSQHMKILLMVLRYENGFNMQMWMIEVKFSKWLEHSNDFYEHFESARVSVLFSLSHSLTLINNHNHLF